MAEKTHTDDIGEKFEINPDGADLDGTAEIERRQAEPDSKPAGSGEDPVPPARPVTPR
jgi:hypothetical protein